MGKIVEIKVGNYRGLSTFHLNDVECNRNDYVIIDLNRGSEFGQVVSDVSKICPSKDDNVKGKILRLATDGDLKQIANNNMKAIDAMNTCMRKVNERHLDMNLVKCEYTFDSSKIIFYFTSDGRVDFRNLVKDLARIFRVRIELKQIGVRDKAKIVSGYGICGRELCCSSFMKGFHPLSIKMAKGQGLPLNPSRISGVCGRIKCCMAYEYDAYKYLSKKLPKVGDKISLEEGKGRVIDVNILKRTVSIELEEGQVIKKEYAMSYA